MERIVAYLKKHPPLILSLSFLVIILIGSLILMMPISRVEDISYIDALFTATSAVCVTGLVTLPSFSTWTVFGKVTIIFLIQIGGLGFMTFTTLLAIILRKRISITDRIILKEQVNSDTLGGMVRLITYILRSTFLIEGIGAILLSFYFVPRFGLKGIPYSIFHSISAFCNAGFDILASDSLISFNKETYLLMVLGLLVFLGSLGFVVYSDLWKNKLSFKKYSLHTKLVIVVSFSLIIFSSICFFFLEGNNPKTLLGLDFVDKLTNSVFQSITLRTAGFDSLSQANLTEASSVISILNMFIGGSPASTAGGIKTVTFAVLCAVVISVLRQREEVEIFSRRINKKLIYKALTIIMLGIFWVGIVTILILIVSGKNLLDVLFEVVSAFATVGLSRNLTSSLDSFSKVFIIMSMYVGRTGLITVILAIVGKSEKKLYKEAEENVIIG